MKSNSLDLHGLVVAREGVALTPPLNITLSAGEMLAIRGRNGSGKSTLLRTIAGLILPMSGSIKINGDWPSSHPILYLGHKRGLAAEMSVYDNVSLWARLSGYKELIPVALHYFELLDIADVPLRTLSAGWQQRVALTRLITQPASLWLLDEPYSNLDSYGIELMQNLMQSRMEQGGIIATATHMHLTGKSIKEININELN